MVHFLLLCGVTVLFIIGSRLDNFVIEALLSHPTRKKECAAFTKPRKDSETFHVRCPPGLSGDRVRIKRRTAGVLQLCEVEVYGFPSKIYTVDTYIVCNAYGIFVNSRKPC